MKKGLFLFVSLLCVNFLSAQKLFEPNYGMVVNANFVTLGKNAGGFTGRTMGSFGVFFQNAITPYHTNRFLNRLDYTLEPAMTWLGIRDFGTDKQFTNKYIDFSAYINYVPDLMSDDLRLCVGVRPSYLTYSSSSIIEFGTYRELSSDSQNLNRSGDIDFSAIVGVSVNMGDVASLELKYVHSFTNQTNGNVFFGRPSSIEVGLRLSAVRIRNKIVKTEKNQVDELNKRAQGTLLVMLEEPDEKLIQQLVEEHKVEDAKYVRNLQNQTNQNIMREMRAHFDFCRVEFFLNSNAHKVNRGDFDGIFLDDYLHIKPDVTIDTANYFIGAFIEDVSEYTHKPDYGFYLYDQHFVQLGSPYNTGVNGLGIFVGGDPMNYFRRVKTSGYYPEDFRKVIKKVNAKLQLGRIPENQ